MKNLIIIPLIFITSLAFSQEKADSLRMPTKNGKVEISEVVTLKDRKAGELFTNALLFVAEEYYNPQKVTKLSDRVAGKILISTNFAVEKYFQIRCMLELDVKDGKYRYVFKDFTYQVVTNSLTGDLAPKEKVFDTVFPNENYKDPNVYTKLAKGTLDGINLIINSLKKTMSKNDSF